MIQQTDPPGQRTSHPERSELHWGQWHAQRYYSLEVIQHPLRARMCGFGDKDRRPLAPAPVARMAIRRSDDSVVDVDEVDYSFFLVTADLWSADGKQDMNFVLHPSSERSSLSPVQLKKGGLSNPAPQTAPSLLSHNSQKSSSARSKTPTHGLSLPSIHSIARTPSNGTDPWSQTESETGTTYHQPVDNNSNSHIDPALRDPALDGPFLTPSYDSPHRFSSNDPPPFPQTTATIASRHPYTRTLIGPLAANACRLADEHKKPGIFFLFQDLSIRIEGTFRLRLRLFNVGASPAPEAGATRVHNDTSPILAQTFTEPFEVYSAKRFPGVPDTTALSIALGNQGQKLPLRNRHGSGKRRREDACSSDDSDGA